MNVLSRIMVVAAFAAMAVTAISPAANADSQSNKNLWRNLSIAAGAATVYGLSKHDTATSLIGAAGTAYSLKRYEDARHGQSLDNARRRAYYHRYATTYARPARYYYTTNNYYGRPVRRYYYTRRVSRPYYYTTHATRRYHHRHYRHCR